MSLRGIAQETLRIIHEGRYVTPSGKTVDIGREVRAATESSVTYEPDDFDLSPTPGHPKIEISDETTQVAARRLVQDEGVVDPVLLNFASARNPGGGFLGGAKAQEEDLCRCSALFGCLLEQRTYYDRNRAQPSVLYTDHIIYSPKVPFFRDRSRGMLESPFLASVITAPAPNAGQHLRRAPHDREGIERALHLRTGKVLSVARRHGHRTLILGAWGCGVFQNDPHQVARAFAHWIGEMGGAFDRVLFAIPAGNANLDAFERELRARS